MIKTRLTDEQLGRLRAFRDEHGRTWRAKLRTMWMSGEDVTQADGHLLRQVRNIAGPSGLDSVVL